MNLYEYKITRHPAETFEEMVYFCTRNGDCKLGNIPVSQIEKIEGMLNERGRSGWELLQVSFGKDGILAFWKRIIRGESIETIA